MEGENVEIYGVQIVRKSICDSKNRKIEIFTKALKKNSPPSSYYHHTRTQTRTHTNTRKSSSPSSRKRRRNVF